MLELLIAFFLVILNGFFVAAEFAIVKVRSTRIQELMEQGKPGAAIAHRAVQHLDAYLSATQLGITLASLGLGWIGEPAFAHLLDPLFNRFGEGSVFASHAAAVAVAFLIITFLHIVFGELAPKSLAILKSEAVTLAVAWPLHFFYLVFYPAIWLLNNVANGVLRLVGLEPASEHENVHTLEELRMILAESARGGSLKDSEALLVERSFDFADIDVEDVMVPRVDIRYLSAEWDRGRILEEMEAHRHSRYLIVEDEDLDHVLGFVRIEDLLFGLVRDGVNLRDILRPLHMVPEHQSVERLLREMQVRHTEIALVLDEFGGTAGMVTIKDLLEELVGDFDDESDREPPEVRRTEEGWLVRGGASLSDVNRELEAELLSSEHYSTLAGWVMEQLGRVPAEGDGLESGGYRFRVRRMKGHRVVEVEIRPKGGGVAEPGE
jgi:CBS domain containing-hemolysin-like protein